MGYHLTIGNAELEFDAAELRCAPTVVGFADIEAPVFPNDEMTGDTSERSPSYTAWHHFAALTGLTTLFFGGTGWDDERGRYKDCPEGYHREEGLIAQHPGVAVLCDGDLQEVRRALAEWKAKHPDTVPGFGNWDGGDSHYDYTLARLIWLEFWIAWALKNCERPAFGNT